MSQWIPQPSFGRGEISPSLYGRFDLSAYSIGAKVLENWLVTRAGGIINTPGTKFIGEVKDSSKRHRLIPFAFNTTQTYALEFGDLTMRVIKDGGYVLEGNKVITGITKANPAVVTSAAHSYANGDWVYISGVVGMTEVNGRTFKVAGAATNTFQLQEVDGTNVNSTSYSNYTSAGTAARVYTLATPYAHTDLPLLKYKQSADVMTLTHKAYEQRELTRTGHANWTLTTVTYGPTIAAPAITANVMTGTGTNASYYYKASAIDPTTGEESVPSSEYTATGFTDATWNDGEVLTISGTAAVSVTKVNIYKRKNGIYGFVGQAAASGGTWSFADDKIDPDTLDGPQEQRTPFTGAGNYPQCATYYEQRSVFGGSTNRPQGLDLSQSGSYKNFNVASPLKDSDAISRNIAALQVNEIRHFVPIKELLVLTSGGVWKISAGGQSDVVTPNSITVRLQSGIGVSNVPPLVIGDVVLYVQEKGNIIRDLGYSFQADNYVGADLSIISNHLFEGREVKEWAYAAVPYSIVWTVLDNGQLATMTYLREQELIAWTHQVTDGEYESVCSISEGNEDAVYVIVKRTINGVTKRYVERFASRIVTQPEDAFFVHCGLTYDGTPATVISGLQHLEGKTVAILADGGVRAQQVVTGGKITLSNEASVVHVGLPYVSELETLPVGDTLTRGNPIGQRKKTVKIRARVERSRGMWAGPTRDDMVEMKRDSAWTTALTTEEVELGILPETKEEATIVVQQRDPLPLSILALIPSVDG